MMGDDRRWREMMGSGGRWREMGEMATAAVMGDDGR
jgi:hypothetical protein